MADDRVDGVGERERERARVEEALGRGAVVTITGEPGIGKSHLAARLVATERSRIVPCADVRDDDGWARALAVAGVAEDPVADLATLERVVFDDVDRAPRATVVALVQSLADHADTQIVLTSRARLAFPGEHLVELPRLAPEAALALFDALALRHRGAGLRDHEREDARHLVEALGGNPAALELAAARLRVLGPRALRHRLAEPLALLRDPAAGTSLDAMIAWSWDALDAPLRNVLADLASFEGPFSIADADAVAGRDTLDAVAALRDRSLLVAGDGDADGGAALRVPRTVRAYVRATAGATARDRLATHLAARLRAGATGPRLDAEIHALLQHVAEAELVPRALAEAAVALAIEAAPRVAFVGPREAFLRVVDPVVQVSVRSGAAAELHARVLLARARVRADASAEHDVLAAATLADKVGDDALATAARVGLAELRGDASLLPERPEGTLGDRWDALRMAEDAEAAARLAQSGAPFLAARACAALGRWRAALELGRRDGDPTMVATALGRCAEAGELTPEERRDALRWADEMGHSDLADALREAAAGATLRIDEQGFAYLDAEVSLARRHSLRRILHALARGETLDWAALLDAGWPDEKVGAESGAHRVRVAVSTLRKLGLQPLQTVEGGYRLDPACPLELALPSPS